MIFDEPKHPEAGDPIYLSTKTIPPEDRLIFATNFIFEFEWEHEEEEDEWEREAAFEINIGLAYRVAPGWFLGAELLNALNAIALTGADRDSTLDAFYQKVSGLSIK